MANTHPFRDYKKASKGVKHTYHSAHKLQTLLYGSKMRTIYCQPSGTQDPQGRPIRKTIHDVFTELQTIYDESDPDTNQSQLVHAYQTGEGLRTLLDTDDETKLKTDISIKDLYSAREWEALPAPTKRRYERLNLHELYPDVSDWSWLPLVGFIHDLGKVLASPKWGNVEQWSVVGDTFPVGAPFSPSNIFYKKRFFQENPDLSRTPTEPKKFGRYKKHCGFNQVFMSFGHDEYMYSVLNRTIHSLPPHALYIIRYHSFYPWHTPRNGVRGYTELASRYDRDMLPLLKLFQRSDLYTKKDDIPDPQALKEYYDDLIAKFIPARESSSHALRPAVICW